MNRLSDVLLVGAAVLALAAGVLRTTPGADAQSFGPEVTGGSHAWLDFAQVIPHNNTVTILTVPADRVFVMTGGNFNQWIEVLEDGVVKVPRWAGVAEDGPLSMGKGHVTFAPGSEVQVLNAVPGTQDYMVTIFGYLAHP